MSKKPDKVGPANDADLDGASPDDWTAPRRRANRFTAERRQRFLSLLAGGLSYRRACARIGSSKDTPAAWAQAGHKAIAKRERGRALTEREAEQAEFAEKYGEAMTTAELQLLTVVQRQSAQDWRAAAWLLSVRWTEEYSERWKTMQAAIEADPSKSPEARLAVIDKLRADADVAMAKAKAAQAATAGGGGLVLVGLEALLDDESLTAGTRAEIEAYLAKREAMVISPRDLTRTEDES